MRDVPSELYACELCGESACTRARFAACEFRIHSAFLERRYQLQKSAVSDDMLHAVDQDDVTFEVMPLSPGILPGLAKEAHPGETQDEDMESSAKSGFRLACPVNPTKPEVHSETIRLGEVEPRVKARS